MVRKSLWIGLRLGILAGVVFAVAKTVQARRAGREPLAPARAWQPPPPPPEPERARETPRTSRPAATRPAPSRPPQPPMPPRPSAVPPPGPPPVVEPPPAAETPATPTAEPRSESEPTAEPTTPAKKAAKRAKKAAKKAKKAAKKADAASSRAWVEPHEGACPQSHPVKAKLSSKIFHLPGMLAYERTNADRCYSDADTATGDGFRAAKR